MPTVRRYEIHADNGARRVWWAESEASARRQQKERFEDEVIRKVTRVGPPNDYPHGYECFDYTRRAPRQARTTNWINQMVTATENYYSWGAQITINTSLGGEWLTMGTISEDGIVTRPSE